MDAPQGSYSGTTPTDFIATAFYAYSTRILRDAAKVIGKYDDIQEYTALLDKIIEQFNYEFVSPSGRLVSPNANCSCSSLDV
ncbi:alpha-L-rhamnosidase-related protein [Metabacillus sp. Hm71]|uniref:alpha-L-rhamnosidase-related protein n=1 Tax=Metabacillus sp. Hm71 TaxID=3450743 RepID=UPI003F41F671